MDNKFYNKTCNNTIKHIIVNSVFLLTIIGCSTENRTQSRTLTQIEYDNVSKAIGHLISYEINSKIDLSYGMKSPLKEVMKTYHASVAHLPKEEQVKFFFLVESNINVHGGEDLFVFYNFVYLACGEEYIQFLKQNSNNPYFKPNMINLFLKSIEEREPQLKLIAKRKGKTFNDYLKELRLEYGFK